MATYAVLDRHGSLQDRGLDASAAAQLVLTHDGHEYEIRSGGKWLDLWVSRASRNASGGTGGMTRSIVFGATEDDIWREVIARAGMWDEQIVHTDSDYDVLSRITD